MPWWFGTEYQNYLFTIEVTCWCMGYVVSPGMPDSLLLHEQLWAEREGLA